jgi:cellobiose-specific phosphotransferase system component IIC
MDELRANSRSGGSVWGVAVIAVILFVSLVWFVGMFGAQEIASVANG